MESPPPVPPAQSFHHEPKVDKNKWDSLTMYLPRRTSEIQKLGWAKWRHKDWWVISFFDQTMILFHILCFHRRACLLWLNRLRWLVWQMLSPGVFVGGYYYQPPLIQEAIISHLNGHPTNFYRTWMLQGSSGGCQLKRGNRDDPHSHQSARRSDQAEKCHKRGCSLQSC